MSCFSQTEHSHNRSITKQPQPTMIKPELAASLSVARTQNGMLPFLADPQQAFTPKIHDLASALYGLPYGSPTAFYHGMSSPGFDPSALYNSMNRTDIKELPNPWRGVAPSLPGYDPVLASLLYSGGLSHLGLSDGVRRKNATRETTSVLKRWLDSHKKNPYPTKSEKIFLALQSKMTLTQVSTWFANARRRLKKENKMTWSPRHGADDRDSGEENGDHGFPISPREHDNGSTPSKSGSSPNPTTDIRDNPMSASNDLPYQQYQQQMLLRHFALLPPHLRTPEAFKQVQEQMQMRSRWAATAVTDSDARSTEQNRTFVSPLKTSPIIDPKLLPERRSSVGSPSTSSYDRSPSPFHRSSQSTWVSPSLSDHAAAFRKTSSNSEPMSDLTKQQDEKSGRDRQRVKSSEDGVKPKPSIWSPASMVNAKNLDLKPSMVDNSLSSSLFANAISPTSKPFINSKADSLIKATNTETVSSNKANISPVDTVNFPLHVNAYFREYQRHLAAQHSLQNQQSLSSNLLQLPINKTESLVHSQLLESFRKSQGLQQKFELPHSADEAEKEMKKRRSSMKEDEHISYDIPMNLSKSVKTRENLSQFDQKEKDFRSKTEAWSGSSSPI